jgi:hypothetical protein
MTGYGNYADFPVLLLSLLLLLLLMMMMFLGVGEGIMKLDNIYYVVKINLSLAFS